MLITMNRKPGKPCKYLKLWTNKCKYIDGRMRKYFK